MYANTQTSTTTNNNMDVICGRGKTIANHPGNKRFKQIVRFHLPQYKQATNKVEKSMVVSSILKDVRRNGVQFVRKDQTTGLMETVSERVAREKVGQGLRDALHTVYKSSSKSKNSKRKAQKVSERNETTNLVISNHLVSTALPKVQNQVDDTTSDDDAVRQFACFNMNILNKFKNMLDNEFETSSYSSSSTTSVSDTDDEDEFKNIELFAV